MSNQVKHKYKRGRLVEFMAPFEFKGIRLYVTNHTYSLKGERLYCLGAKKYYNELQIISEYFDYANVPEINLKPVRLTIWQKLNKALFKELNEFKEVVNKEQTILTRRHGPGRKLEDLPPTYAKYFDFDAKNR